MNILEDLWNAELNYKGTKVNGFGIPIFLINGCNQKTLSSTISRLKSRDYILKTQQGWVLTEMGRKYYKSRRELRSFESPFKKNSPKNLIVMFDVPEERKYEREWLRNHLRRFGYQMIQKSVWVGPSPLPREFTGYAKEIGIKKCIATFKLAKPYKKSSR
ncbi:MAG TPA: CRISPR-associated endonuclease Cas2 [Candidatus Paceibacterota bacterium]|nr:CRISPR-associated endonuclease Cas2 [Candidatus Paceibacterota bacterium]